MLDKEQAEQVRQMIVDATGTHYAEIKGMLNVISANLIRIEGIGIETRTEAKKTNGQVMKLKEEIIPAIESDIEELQRKNLVHVVNCPNTEKLTKLENKELGRTSILRFIGTVALVVASVAGLVIAVLEIVYQTD